MITNEVRDRACWPSRDLHVNRAKPVMPYLRCPVKKKGCDKFKTCELLAQCILQHSRVKNNPALLLRLASTGTISLRKVVRILEEDHPGLKRMNDRESYKPSEADWELNDRLYGR